MTTRLERRWMSASTMLWSLLERLKETALRTRTLWWFRKVSRLRISPYVGRSGSMGPRLKRLVSNAMFRNSMHWSSTMANQVPLSRAPVFNAVLKLTRESFIVTTLIDSLSSWKENLNEKRPQSTRLTMPLTNLNLSARLCAMNVLYQAHRLNGGRASLAATANLPEHLLSPDA